MNALDSLPVVVIGAGPVGLAAAAHLHERGLPFLVLEAGDTAGAAVRQWGHVRVFSPWRYNIDPAARRLLDEAGWVAPDLEALPTGGELVGDYLAAPRAAAAAQATRALRRPGRGDQPPRARPAAHRRARHHAVPDPPRRRRRTVRPRRHRRLRHLAYAERPRRLRPARPGRGRRGRVPGARAARRARRRPGPVRRSAHPGRRRWPLRREHPAVPGRAGRHRARHRGDLGDPERVADAYVRRRGRRRPPGAGRARLPAARARRRRADPPAHRLLGARAHPDRRTSRRRRAARRRQRGVDQSSTASSRPPVSAPTTPSPPSCAWISTRSWVPPAHSRR